VFRYSSVAAPLEVLEVGAAELEVDDTAEVELGASAVVAGEPVSYDGWTGV